LLNGKNSFAEVSKNLDTDLKIILLHHQNNCRTRRWHAAKNFNILATSLSVLYNYFDGPNKIIFRTSSKFLDTSAKPFFLSYSFT